MKPFAIAAVLAATLTLAACGDAPDQPATEAEAAPATEVAPAAAAPIETAPAAETPAAATELPANTMVPGTDMTVEQAMETVQSEVEQLNLTDEQKQQAVADARTQAEAAAKSAGLSDAQVKQAGDAAEQAARTMFGIQ